MESNINAPLGAKNNPYANKGYRYYVLGALTTAYAFNFVDRQILAILQEPIKAELGLSDGQLGLLTGFAFAMFYVVMGIPIARIADRGIRRNIIVWAIGIWSLMTAFCGLAQNFIHLLLARIGVGVGEAGCSPPAHSMISDIFPPSTRATALATYNVGVNIGILVGFMMGGWLHELYGWRVAFYAVGIPGILLALVFRFTIKEPQRGYSEGKKQSTDTTPQPTAKEVITLLWSKRTFRHLMVASSMVAFSGYGLLNWLPSFLVRSHGLGTGEIGTWLALIAGIGGGIGTFAAGYFADRLGARDGRWYVWISALGFSIQLPLIITMLLIDNSNAALLCFIIPGALGTIYLAPVIAVAHSLVENRMRALASAIVFLIINLIGLGLGPLLVGIVSDLLAPSLGSESLRYSLLLLAATAITIGIVHFSLAARTIREETS